MSCCAAQKAGPLCLTTAPVDAQIREQSSSGLFAVCGRFGRLAKIHFILLIVQYNTWICCCLCECLDPHVPGIAAVLLHTLVNLTDWRLDSGEGL